ncbi:sesquipedalian [Anaeramoeba flamelloides]|uniref:Sesquipedalian n=1 Tax=Anaeramoeba flamelloides TaxID=1746091 RepID=A0AAV7ZQ17_9EUKA|nr:sesquipedalian [Anaeramoeba flamelloides]
MDSITNLDKTTCTIEHPDPNQTLYRYHHSYKKENFDFHGPAIVFLEDKVPTHSEFWYKNWRIAATPTFSGHMKPREGTSLLNRYSGYITKTGGRVKTKKTRWFNLTDYNLEYYKNEESEMINKIEMNKIQKVEMESTKKKISVHIPKRVYHFHFNDEVSLKTWNDAINNVISLRTLVRQGIPKIEKILDSNDRIEHISKMIDEGELNSKDFSTIRRIDKSSLFLFILTLQDEEQNKIDELLDTLLQNGYSLILTNEIFIIGNSNLYITSFQKIESSGLWIRILQNVSKSAIEIPLKITQYWLNTAIKNNDERTQQNLITSDPRLKDFFKNKTINLKMSKLEEQLLKSKKEIFEIENKLKDELTKERKLREELDLQLTKEREDFKTNLEEIQKNEQLNKNLNNEIIKLQNELKIANQTIEENKKLQNDYQTMNVESETLKKEIENLKKKNLKQKKKKKIEKKNNKENSKKLKSIEQLNKKYSQEIEDLKSNKIKIEQNSKGQLLIKDNLILELNEKFDNNNQRLSNALKEKDLEIELLKKSKIEIQQEFNLITKSLNAQNSDQNNGNDNKNIEKELLSLGEKKRELELENKSQKLKIDNYDKELQKLQNVAIENKNLLLKIQNYENSVVEENDQSGKIKEMESQLSQFKDQNNDLIQENKELLKQLKDNNKRKASEKKGGGNEIENKDENNESVQDEIFMEDIPLQTQLENYSINYNGEEMVTEIEKNIKIILNNNQDNQRIMFNNNWFIRLEINNQEIINISKFLFWILKHQLKQKNMTIYDIFNKLPSKSANNLINFIQKINLNNYLENTRIITFYLFIIYGLNQGILIRLLNELFNEVEILQTIYNQDKSYLFQNDFRNRLVKLLNQLTPYMIRTNLEINEIIKPDFLKIIDPASSTSMIKNSLTLLQETVNQIVQHFQQQTEKKQNLKNLGNEKKDKVLSNLMRDQFFKQLEKALLVGFKTKKTFGQNHPFAFFETISSKSKSKDEIISIIRTNIKTVNGLKNKIGKEDKNKFVALMLWSLNDQQMHLYLNSITSNLNIVSKYLESDQLEYQERLAQLIQIVKPLSNWKFNTPINFKLKK